MGGIRACSREQQCGDSAAGFVPFTYKPRKVPSIDWSSVTAPLLQSMLLLKPRLAFVPAVWFNIMMGASSIRPLLAIGRADVAAYLTIHYFLDGFLFLPCSAPAVLGSRVVPLTLEALEPMISRPEHFGTSGGSGFGFHRLEEEQWFTARKVRVLATTCVVVNMPGIHFTGTNL